MSTPTFELHEAATHVPQFGPVTLSHEEASAVRLALATASAADGFETAVGYKIAAQATRALAIMRAAQDAAIRATL